MSSNELPNELVYLLAQAINGPYDLHDTFDSKGLRYTLKEIRGAKWGTLTRSEHLMKINEAKSVIHTLMKRGINLYDLCKISPVGSHEDTIVVPTRGSNISPRHPSRNKTESLRKRTRS